VGRVSFYVAGNAANSDGGPGGDFIYTNSRSTLAGSAISNFDNDTRSDVAIFRPSNGTWYSLSSITGNLSAVQFGASGDRIVPGDYDGDGRNDYAVWRPSSGVWFIQRSSGGSTSAQLGASTDIPVVGDYDGDLLFSVRQTVFGMLSEAAITNFQLHNSAQAPISRYKAITMPMAKPISPFIALRQEYGI
jgi:hypothetical protein